MFAGHQLLADAFGGRVERTRVVTKSELLRCGHRRRPPDPLIGSLDGLGQDRPRFFTLSTATRVTSFLDVRSCSRITGVLEVQAFGSVTTLLGAFSFIRLRTASCAYVGSPSRIEADALRRGLH